ncbi:Mrp/NBP35 family ATP-binding protein [Polluticaenibacter yanchengensis]|uniref:Iron-sulfur cluster carrier protein n=1 Tax=Polluticaenibacter yanchengensis TaxID=3014562 RepID=A0ABT4UKT2_9BACT|nr:Mrp/NBP35 family ATP-binding protein [Chitinophagaceae bacterium LY-5]
MTDQEILEALSGVVIPGETKSIVQSNYITDIFVNKRNLFFTIKLPMKDSTHKGFLNEQSETAIKNAFGNDVNVHVNFTVTTSSARTLEQTTLPGVKNIIAVVSGKGGVGKSTVSANLALALRESGATVGLLDADIYGPSVPIMFGVRGKRPMMRETENGKGVIVPLDRYGLKLMSIGLLVDDKNAVVWRGPMASSAIKQFITDVDWGELDYLVIDMPPGTGDIHLTIMQTVPVTGVIVVSTPQDVALADAKKGIAMFGQAQINVPIIGLVENMSWFTPAELPDNKYYIFGKEGGKKLADEYDIPFLGQIPIVQSIREGGDLGVPVMMSDEQIVKDAFLGFADTVIREVGARNEKLAPTKPIEITER